MTFETSLNNDNLRALPASLRYSKPAKMKVAAKETSSGDKPSVTKSQSDGETVSASKRERSPEATEDLEESAKRLKNEESLDIDQKKEQKDESKIASKDESATTETTEKQGSSQEAAKEEKVTESLKSEGAEERDVPEPSEPVGRDEVELAKKKGENEATKEAEKGAEKEAEKEASKASPETPKSAAKPKFAFGASSGFSAGFGVAKTSSPGAEASELQSDSVSNSSSSKPASKPAAFGSGFAFGKGFYALNKDKDSTPKVFTSDAEKLKSPSPTAGISMADKSSETSGSGESDGVVKLTKQDVKSGEESEESVLQVNAKLYQLINLKEGWKERGVGALHVNKNPHTGKARIVMRSRGILKVIMNVSLVKGVAIHKGFPASLQGEKFIRIVTVDHDKTPIQYAVKIGKAEMANELYDTITKLIP